MFTYYEFVAYNVSFNQFLLKTKIKYDIITFFNVDSVRNFQKMFPKYQQGKTIFIGFDENVYNALKSLNFKVHAVVSINENKSMVMMIKKILAI
jgi:hypothetical protein